MGSIDSVATRCSTQESMRKTVDSEEAVEGSVALNAFLMIRPTKETAGITDFSKMPIRLLQKMAYDLWL